MECNDLRLRNCFSRWTKRRARIKTLTALEREQSVTTIDNYDSLRPPSPFSTASLRSQFSLSHCFPTARPSRAHQLYSIPLPSAASDIHSPDTLPPSHPRRPLSLPSPFSSPLNLQPLSNNRVCPVVRKHQRSADAKKRRQKLKKERKRLRKSGVQCPFD